jgi:serine/threonine protein kinase
VDSAWFARPTSVVWQNGRPALRLEDPGGTVLEKRLGRPLELQLALRLGIGLASALSRFHAVGLIHRKLGPNNVFIDLDTGNTRLVGAYIALGSSSEGSEALEALGMNLVYLAPEQTGHMNRSPDARSDLLISARDLPVTVDIRVETPACGFSLAEYVEPSAESMLLRTCAGPILSEDPWSADLLSASSLLEAI